MASDRATLNSSAPAMSSLLLPSLPPLFFSYNVFIYLEIIYVVYYKFSELSQSAWDVVEILYQRPKATVKDICNQLNLKDRQVNKHISTLKSVGLLVRVGSNKTGYWKVTVK